ncbi:MAG: DUF58 domain-containing protein [Planctomycetota bacterium]
MMYRRRVALSREGWYYLFVLAFILGGALFREVNLLLMLAGMMLGPMVFSWRLAAVTLGQLTVRRTVPPLCHAGELTTIELTVQNERYWLPSWMLTASDYVAGVTNATVLFAKLPAHHAESQSYRIRFLNRGRYEFSHVRLGTRFPFGFVRAEIDIPCPGQLVVAPALGQLTRRGNQLIAGGAAKHKSSRRRGVQQGEYYGLRDWRTGDSRRWIHWRSSAKSGELAVLQFHEQQADELVLIADLWQSSQSGTAELQRVEMVLSVVATLIMATATQPGQRLTVGVLGEQFDCWQDSSSPLFIRQLMEQLSVVRGSASSNLAASSWSQLPRHPAGRTLVISTRSQSDFSNWLAAQAPVERNGAALAHWLGSQELRWVNVANDSLAELFQPPQGAT